jgi:hypothetical protein
MFTDLLEVLLHVWIALLEFREAGARRFWLRQDGLDLGSAATIL